VSYIVRECLIKQFHFKPVSPKESCPSGQGALSGAISLELDLAQMKAPWLFDFAGRPPSVQRTVETELRFEANPTHLLPPGEKQERDKVVLSKLGATKKKKKKTRQVGL